MSLQAITDGFKRLQQGLPVAHTPAGTDTALELAAVDNAGKPVDVTVPDYAGEDLRNLADGHRVPDKWREHASRSDHWLLMIRLGLHLDIPDLLTKPVGELARASDGAAGEGHGLPVDIWAVELLQVLLHARAYSTIARPSNVNIQVPPEGLALS